MEVEEELTSNRLQESTTTVSNERILEKYTSNDEELGKEASESNTQEEKGEDSSAAASKLDDPTTAVAVTESAEEEVIVQRDNFEVNKYGNSLVVEDSCVLKDEKKDDEGVVKVEIPNDDVAGLERDGSEFINAGIVDGREGEPGVIVRDDGLDLVAEHAKLSGENTNTDGSLVIEDDKDGVVGETETVKAKDDDKVLKDGGVVNVPTSPVSDIGERVEVMTDAIKNDLDDSQKENVEIVPGEETVTEDQDGAQVVNAEVVKEKRIVADEEAAIGVEEGAEEGKLADKEKGEVADDAEREKGGMVGDEKAVVTENDEAEPMVADVEEPLDTEFKSDEEPTMAGEDEVPVETDLPESSIKSSKEKRKRGRKSSQTTPKSVAGRGKMSEEDVCFICFDGGDLVLCDQRNCPKAYHPSCVNRDAAFFQTKGKWNCGWHLCSNCEKKAEYMCYTCTFALCKGCIDANLLLRVREKEKKGFCEACLKTVMLIENKPLEEQGNVDFDDKSSWEYLFKDYWTDTKAKIDLSLSELVEAMNARKESALAGKQELSSAQYALRDDGGSGSENPSENQETKKNKGRMRKRRKSSTKEEELSTGSVGVASEWASKELLEFVMHMGNGDKSFKSQFDVQALLLEYIKTNNLRDPRRKTHIICDARLERLFGKPRVGHFEMLKLLESHFLIKEDSEMDGVQGSVVDTELNQVDDDETNGTIAKRDKKRKTRKKSDREPQSNREDYAAVDNHNINVLYLRRKLVEDLLDDTETFHNKVVGMFVRIKISGANQKHDLYRLVPVTGTIKAAPYALGKKTTEIMLEILNLDKTESVSIDTISNHDFTEDECKRLRQSIKCGLIKRLKVGDILDKAMELQAARVNDCIEAEVLRISHLRDRASDLGRKKELRECVEKLIVLKTPEERARRLEEIPVIHADPTMDPNYESEDDTNEEDKKQDMEKSYVGLRFNRRQDYPVKASRGGTGASGTPGKNYEFSKSLSYKSSSMKVEDATTSAHFEPHNNNNHHQLDQGRDAFVKPPNILKKPSSANNDLAPTNHISKTAPEVNETEKMWYYKDPSGKIQGPFSMTQLRKWSNSKFFPDDLRIWRMSGEEDDGILLTDALEGRLTPSDHAPKPSSNERHGFPNLPSPTPNHGDAGLGHVGVQVAPSSYNGRNEGLQSPTPSSSQHGIAFTAGGNKEPNVMGSFATFSEQHNSLQPSQPAAPHANSMVQSVSGQILHVGPYDWSGGPPPHPLPTPLSNVAGQQQQLAFNMVQNSGGNFLHPSGLGPVNPQQTVLGNPTMGLVGLTPGSQTMNWGPSVQAAQLMGNANSQWGLQAGVAGWVPPPGQGPVVTGNGNPSWAGTPGASDSIGGPGNQGGAAFHGPVPVNTDMGWGLTNQGWVSPTPRNRSMLEGNEQHGSGFSGQDRSRGRRGGASGYRGGRGQGSFNNRGRGRGRGRGRWRDSGEH